MHVQTAMDQKTRSSKFRERLRDWSRGVGVCWRLLSDDVRHARILVEMLAIIGTSHVAERNFAR
jgi:hypothetical protein